MKFGACATITALAASIGLVSCQQQEKAPTAPAPAAAPNGPAGGSFVEPGRLGVPAPVAATPISVQAANSGVFTPPPADATTPSATLLRAQVLLDRAGFSPGVIDARYGENVRQALAAFQEAKGLPRSGQLDTTTWQALQSVGGPAVLARYVITEQDVAGPFIAGVPDKLQDQAHLTALSYTSAAELIAERFHMDEQMLRDLNPGQTFTGAGAEIIDANPARPQIAGVDHIEVDAKERAVKVFDASGMLLAFYPATIGSSDNPSPAGAMKINGVGRNPTYTYDPAKLDYANHEIKRKLVVPAGPNNPVGSIWIDLSKPTYGIHGTPNPDVVGKSQSHGCVRLTNWDVIALAAGVKPGVKVTFV
jgi:lipoprotein-anchoring transpeptidase ErfK/SrfK